MIFNNIFHIGICTYFYTHFNFYITNDSFLLERVTDDEKLRCNNVIKKGRPHYVFDKFKRDHF